ncbi:PucR family transcriptional regulator [Leucobacter weissii]|uniref:PucR family transcriptional regulator n=1 Tax=Leucobacter weissii TaxID=1983706 RepID=A0A939ML78_9MICO|nr:PucR family transcriptional regulator [Leucobacter weissii]MBO1902813.1 PucR family transcriptional regulator [Leucobacter weissii]
MTESSVQSQMRVSDVLELPEVRAGEPDIVAGSAGLGRSVRWAHVVAGAGALALLEGGELILTTGAGWSHGGAELARIARGLAAADPAGVILELGAQFAEAPAELILACEAAGIPLIALHREVRFVQITQRVHQRILAAQNEALEARAEVHAMLTELGLNRSPIDYVVEQLAETLSAPVVLEDPAHRVVALAGLGTETARTLEPWSEGREPELPDGSERVPVEARGIRWGILTALPGPAHAAGRRTVLELGAFALALGRLADSEGEQWLRFGSKRLFDLLLGGRYRNDAELSAQLAAAGLPTSGRVVIAATLHGTGDFGAHDSLERATVETALRRAVAPEGRVLVASDDSSPGGLRLALISLPEGDARIGEGALPEAPELARRLARELDMLVPATTPPSWRTHVSLGAPSRRLRQLVASLEQVRSVGRLPSAAEVGRVTVQQTARQPLAHLVRRLSGMPELQEYTADVLGPLVEHDGRSGPGHSGDLLRVLAAYIAHPTNRSLAAQRARLSRSVFYQRLALIEELLGADLTDGEVIATLTVALLARRE